MQLGAGDLLDQKYRIVRLLGTGSMGAVYEGENVRVHRRVAIKVLHPRVAADHGSCERFEREAQAAGRIGSKHIVEVYDMGEMPDGARYIVMEFLGGETLSSRLRTAGRLSPEVAAPLVVQLLEGLMAAHAVGIVHRDLKPDNIFLQAAHDRQEFVKILDFGVSKFGLLTDRAAANRTAIGAVIGTPNYMSPEQVQGSSDVDHRSDLYSVGVVLFECVTGRVPFRGETFQELAFKIAIEPVPRADEIVPGLDPRVAEIIRTAMSRDRFARYQSCQDFALVLADWHHSASGANRSRPAMTLAAPPTAAAPPPAAESLARERADASLATSAHARSVLTKQAPAQKKGLYGAVLALAALALAVAMGAVWWMHRAEPAKQPAAVDRQAVRAEPSPAPAAPPSTHEPSAPPPQDEPSATVSPVAPTAPATANELPSALPDRTAPGRAPVWAAPAGTTRRAPPAASASVTVEGRSIRTEL